jgi:hypothetical protein
MSRATRAEETAQERRRRSPGTLDRMAQLKLAVPDSVREENKDYALRWINDEGNRMHFMTVQDDWDVIDGVQPVPVGTDAEGKPVLARLCRKPMKFWEEDQKAKTDALKEQEAGLMRGQRDNTDELPSDVSYVPKGNSITSGYAP